MISNYNNYGLFDKYLNKIKTSTVAKFGSLDRLQTFLQQIAEQGNVILAVKSLSSLNFSPLEIAKLIKKDKYLDRCVELALVYAAEVVEAVLYDRAINGYEELTYNKDGQCIARKRKYCSKSLLEYLKANSPKYCSSKNSILGKKSKISNGQQTKASKEEMPSFEVESYEEKAG